MKALDKNLYSGYRVAMFRQQNTFKYITSVTLVCCATATYAQGNNTKARDEYVKRIAIAAEHDGWQLHMSASKPGCSFVCLGHGDHTALRIVMWNASPEGFDDLCNSELHNRIPELRRLGFTQIDVVGMQPSESYPNGEAHIQFPPVVEGGQ